MDYITRSEFERFVKEHERIKEDYEEIKRRIEQRTEEIRAVRVDVASEDVIRHLDNLKQELQTLKNTGNALQQQPPKRTSLNSRLP
jgi:molecular chaperone GrpE (heat shock protein)